jgi:glycolate oxidase iron-sulfur subunit
MQTHLAPEFQGTPDGQAAEAILRKCVHCGFCTATCPTYQLLGDELDGPRGRIYLMKQVLEGAQPTRKTQLHLDRCLTCRNCESTCPSGVDYGHLVDIGRKIVDAKVQRPATEKAVRWLLKEGLTSPAFSPAMKLGQLVRGLMPETLKNKVPARQNAGRWPTATHARKVLMLAGCVQPAMMPNINTATARVLDAAGIQTVVAPEAGCCGAVKFHLNDQDGGKAQMRANIDAWWPHVEQGVEAIVMNASGCGVTVKEYGHILADDPAYAAKAARISELTQRPERTAARAGAGAAAKAGATARREAGGGLPPALYPAARPASSRAGSRRSWPRWASRDGGAQRVAPVLRLGRYLLGAQPRARLSAARPQAGPSGELKPAVITSANIGCITHLQSGTNTPVRHWVELLDELLQPSA